MGIEIEKGKRIDPEQVITGRSSITKVLEDLANEPGQWKEYPVGNSSVATQIKRNKGFDARTKKIREHADKDGNIVKEHLVLQACYVGPDFSAEIIPRMRKPKMNVQILK